MNSVDSWWWVTSATVLPPAVASKEPQKPHWLSPEVRNEID